jgi:hypothetical protein
MELLSLRKKRRRVASEFALFAALPSLQRFVYAGCHSAGPRFLLGEFFAEPMSGATRNPLIFVRNGWPELFSFQP